MAAKRRAPLPYWIQTYPRPDFSRHEPECGKVEAKLSASTGLPPDRRALSTGPVATDGRRRPDLLPPMETRLDDLDRRVTRIEGVLHIQAGGHASDEGPAPGARADTLPGR